MGSQLSNQSNEVTEDRGDVQSEVGFTINGKKYRVLKEIPLDTSLSTFIRKHAQLTGTKTMCQEGGCGACVVAVRKHHPATGQPTIHAVNSCLVPVYGCEGWEVMTVEGLGSQHAGYHPLQALLAAHNGTQCGYCSPGMVTNMFSLMEENKNLKKADVEHAFDGNICRCTGYRPILEAFKSVAADNEKQPKCQDIEDMLKDCLIDAKYSKKCNSTETCLEGCLFKTHNFQCSKDICSSKSIIIENEGGKWYRPTSKKEIFIILNSIGQETYRFVAGNTAHGVYREEWTYQHYIDISGVGELRTPEGMMVGANTTLSELISALRDKAASESELFYYMAGLADHLTLVANVPVRNVATIAGNLCIKKQHPDFPSDIFLLLETVGAKLFYEKEYGKPQSTNLSDFLSMDLTKTLLTGIDLPPLIDINSNIVRTFKIMARARNVPAYVNAGFRFHVDKHDKFRVKEKPTIVFGGIASDFVHAKETENFLEGKCLLEESVLMEALETLQRELKPKPLPLRVDPHYSVGLATALFYKFMLGLCPDAVNEKYRSGASLLSRPISSSTRDFDTDKTMWPINKPIPKVEALYQCSGEAQYIDDIPVIPGELHGALVLSTVGKGTIQSIDASQALGLPGVVAFYSAKDIPGVNSFTTGFPDDEPIFSDSKILYHGQPVGIVVAETQSLALRAATLVMVKYTDVSAPIVDMRTILRDKQSDRIVQQAEITPTVNEGSGDGETVVVSGEVDLHGQYHMTMELQTCLSVPVEDGMDIYSSTQWMEHVHNAVSRVLNVPAHRLNMKVRRLGGGYGAKLTRSTWVAAQCALAAKLANKPVRLVLSLETNMAAMGKRYDCLTRYKAEVNKSTGKIIRMEGTLYEDAGWSENDPVVEATLGMLPSAYDASTWSVKGSFVKTDKASSTWCRSPGSAEAIGTIEAIMENIATTIGLDPVAVRLANMLDAKTNPVPSMFDYWINHTEYRTRLEEINKFNSENRWKQRGISIVPMTYKLFLASRYNAMVTIYAVDGTVAVSHGGIECGQGINTKVVQVCAYGLGVDLSLIQVKPTDILISPNNEGTGSSVSSESVCFAVMECCRKLNERLEPIRNLMPAGYTWQELIQKAYTEQVKLNASYLFTSKDGVKDYNIYGVTVAEVEVDVLTGQYQLTRVDILEDTGVSLSPEIDVGQVEGAFVMGLGYYMLEQLSYDTDGRLLNNRTWNYYPPGPLDIPVDFRIQFRKKSPNPLGILRSKATGEPPLCMSVAVPLAVCHALQLPQAAAATTSAIQNFQTPYTPEKIFLACKNDISFYKYS